MAANSYLCNHHWVENTDMQSFSKFNTEEANMIVCFAACLMLPTLSSDAALSPVVMPLWCHET